MPLHLLSALMTRKSFPKHKKQWLALRACRCEPKCTLRSELALNGGQPFFQQMSVFPLSRTLPPIKSSVKKPDSQKALLCYVLEAVPSRTCGLERRLPYLNYLYVKFGKARSKAVSSTNFSENLIVM